MKKLTLAGFMGIFVVFLMVIAGCARIAEQALQAVNHAPTIQNLSASPSSVNTQNTAVLNCVATDSDGDSLNYSWTASGGTLVSNVGSSVSWTAPATSGNYFITVTVSDGKDITSGIINIIVSSSSDNSAPNAPTGLTATAGNRLVLLAWTANTESDLYGYNVYRSTSPTSGFSKINSYVIQTNGYTDTSLTNGTTYYYKIAAKDASGNESSYSSVADATPTSTGADSTAPSAPVGLRAIAGAASVNLSWTANTESDLAGYNIYRSTTSGSGYSSIGTVGRTTRYYDESTQSNTSYYYVITALDISNNESSYSEEVSLETSVVTPSAPLGLAAASVTASTALLSWNAVSDATSYKISYGTDTSAANLGTISTTEASYKLSGLTANMTFYVKVSAVNSGGSSAYSSVVSFTTASSAAAPSAPQYPSITNVTSTGATVSWAAVSGATSYTLSYGEDAAASNLGTIQTSNTSYQLTGLAANKIYYVKVSASNASGSSSYSDIASFSSVSSQDYTFVLKWGSKGSENGQFKYAGALAADSSGNIYVTDYTNCYVQKFTSSGEFLAKWGKTGGGAGTGNGEFSYPSDVAIDSQGNVWIADTWNSRVQVFKSDGTFVKKWGEYPTVYGPFGIAIDSEDNVYLTDGFNNKVQKFTSDGTLITSWGTAGSANGSFNFPRGIALDSNGNVYVADQNNYRIQKFTGTGTFISAWGKKGTGDGEFNDPSRIAIDAENNVLVTDFWNNRIQKFSSDGAFLTKWGTAGSGDGQFFEPSGIAIDKDGYIYVTDYNYRVQKFSRSRPDIVPANFVSPSTATREGIVGSGILLNTRNAGTGTATTTNGYFFVGFYISTNETWDNSDVLLTGGREAVITPMSGGETKTVSIYSGMSIPSSITAGSYYLLAVVDEFNAVAESNENNNVAANAITITSQ